MDDKLKAIIKEIQDEIDNLPEEDFYQFILKYFGNLYENQEPLGNDFEKVWNDNVDILYEY